MSDTAPELTILGEITSHYGVKGWVRVHTFTRPCDQITDFAIWTLIPVGQLITAGSTECSGCLRPPLQQRVVDFRWQQKGLIVRLDGIFSRNEAQPLIGMQVGVPTRELPALPEGEYYWFQLIGLTVVNLAGELFGVVDSLMETGANDVLVVKSRCSGESEVERLVPWIPQVIRTVDLESGRLTVDWDPGF